MLNEATLPFLTKLINWKGFELFVRDLYGSSDEMLVQHDVTLIGKSSAKRQVDVLVTQKTKLHTYLTIVECKFWKNKVDRQVLDVLAASIEDLNASKGVIFTVKGYEEGAMSYAKSKNIDIFIVREVKDEEWGHPGKNVILYPQIFNGKITSFDTSDNRFLSTTGRRPSADSLSFELYFKKDMVLEEKFNLYSFPDFVKGHNLKKLIADIRNDILRRWVDRVDYKVQPDDVESEIAYETPIVINFEHYRFKHLKIPEGIVAINKIALVLLQSMTQYKIDFDRTSAMDFVLIVENYITSQRNFVSKPADGSAIVLSDAVVADDAADKEKFINGSTLKVMMDYYVDFQLKENTVVRSTPAFTVNLQEPSI